MLGFTLLEIAPKDEESFFELEKSFPLFVEAGEDISASHYKLEVDGVREDGGGYSCTGY